MSVFYILLIFNFFVFLVIFWYKWKKILLNTFKKNGIPGPEPHLIFGNIQEYQKNGYIKCHDDWIQKYGPIVGYFLGGKPFLLVADPELIKLIQIKDFHLFAKRPLIVDSGLNPSVRLTHSLITCEENRWKQMRSTLTPTFSGSKLRQMIPIIDLTIDKFISRVEENAEQNKEFDIYELFQGLTMDTIAKTGFGFDSGSQDSTEDAMIEAAKGTFNLHFGKTLINLWLLFPELRFIIDPIRRLVEAVTDYFGYSDHGFLLKVADQLVAKRREDMSKGLSGRKDMLQTMIEAEGIEILSTDKLSISTDMSDDSVIESKVSKKSKMTDDEIAANTVLFFDAGYETTSTALAYIVHILINNQDIQDQIREEVQQLLESEGSLDYNTVTKLKFMEHVIYETLRIYPPITTFVSRQSKTDYKYKNITIPKGMDIRVPTYYIQRDSKLWPNPEVFDPKRFAVENKSQLNPVLFQVFGVGPRNCIGMRFALLEIKLTLSKLIIKYKLIASENTQIGDITRDFKIISMTPKNGVMAKAIRIDDKQQN